MTPPLFAAAPCSARSSRCSSPSSRAAASSPKRPDAWYNRAVTAAVSALATVRQPRLSRSRGWRPADAVAARADPRAAPHASHSHRARRPRRRSADEAAAVRVVLDAAPARSRAKTASISLADRPPCRERASPLALVLFAVRWSRAHHSSATARVCASRAPLPSSSWRSHRPRDPIPTPLAARRGARGALATAEAAVSQVSSSADAGACHDIGKIGTKTRAAEGRPARRGRAAEMRRHGRSDIGCCAAFRSSGRAPAGHVSHERPRRKGIRAWLQGDELPLECRYLRGDTYDAMTRPAVSQGMPWERSGRAPPVRGTRGEVAVDAFIRDDRG